MEVDKDGPVLKMGSGYELRFEDDSDFEEMYRELAKYELDETPERRAEGLEELRRLIRGNTAALILTFKKTSPPVFKQFNTEIWVVYRGKKKIILIGSWRPMILVYGRQVS